MKDPGEKVTKTTWEERHQHICRKNTYPRTHLYYLDYELDLIFRKYLKGREGQNIFEIGCGASVWLPYFVREYGMKGFGVDYSPIGIELCQRNLEDNGVEGKLIQADVFELRTEWQSQFKIVFSLGVIEHFEDPKAALEVFQEFLAPGGLLISWVPNLESMILRFSHFLKKDLKDFYTDLPPSKLLEIHRELGLEVLESRYVQFKDFMLVNLDRFPEFMQKGLARCFRGIGWIAILLSRKLRIHPRLKIGSAGFVVVAQKNVRED